MAGLEDLPVAVALSPPLAEEVTAFVEGEAGWQVVGVDGPPRPAFVLCDAPLDGRPCVVVVDGEPDPEVVRAALLGGAVDVVGWPQGRGRLLEAPLRVGGGERQAPAPPCVRVAGAAGGAGTSTVALAVAGLLTWSGRRVIVAGDDDLLRLCGHGPWGGPGTAEVAALAPADAAAEVAVLARAVPGVAGLEVIGGGGATVGSPAGWPCDAVVVDLRATGPSLAPAPGPAGVPGPAGAGPGLSAPPGPAGAGTPPTGLDLPAAPGGWPRDPAIVVARPDAGLRAVAGTLAPVVVAGDGPLDRAAVRRVLGRPPAGWLPRSARVARAGVRGRVPADLPGSWLAALRAALSAVR